MRNYPKAKKSLGQHFLTDKHILEKIVLAGGVSSGDVVLEVGPGRGDLTRVLLEKGARVIAVEVDSALAQMLLDEFSEHVDEKRLYVIEGDILESRTLLEATIQKVCKSNKTNSYKVIANIPYYITGKILRFLFSLELLPNIIVLLIQEEVARRATVVEGEKESLLSLSIKAFGEPHYRGRVKAGSFSPAPKVDSAILSIENITRDYFDLCTEEKFFAVIKKAFSHKRKTLLNTLFNNDKADGMRVLESINLPTTVRPEELTLNNWKELITKIENESN
jgi:16S rRNA (adenine1518-N6/adenine1519-N6)-dimethyltransferase